MLKGHLSLIFFWLILLPGIAYANGGSVVMENASVNCLSAGVISSNTGSTVCIDTPFSLSISAFTSPILGWMISSEINFNAATTTFIPTSLNNLTLSNGISASTHVKVVFESSDLGLCPQMFSDVFTINALAEIDNNLITSNTLTFGCTAQGNIFITGPPATSEVGTVTYVWQMSFDNQSWFTVASGANAVNLTMVQYPNQSVYFRRLINTISCGTNTSNVLHLVYTGETIGGTILGGGDYCFDHENIELSLSGHNGSILEWQSSLNGIDFTGIGGSGQSSIILSNLPTTQYYRVAVQQTGCDLVYSEIAIINIGQLIENNVISSNQVICFGEIPAPISGSIPTGGTAGVDFSILWQMQPEGSLDWINIPVSSIVDETLVFTEPLSVTTHFQRVVSDVDCDFSVSEPVTITVINPIETISNITLCEGGIYQLPNGTSVSTAGTFSFNYTSQTTGCDSTATIIIVMGSAASSGGYSDSDFQQVCYAGNSNPIFLTGYYGEIESWYTASNINGPWTSLNNSSNPITLNNVIANTYLRAQVISSDCGNVWSEIYTLSVYAPISNNTISFDQWLCANSSPQPLLGSIPSGGNGTYSFQWQFSNNQIEWNNVLTGGNSFNYSIGTISQTTHYRRIVSSGSCLASISNTTTIELIPEPSGYLSAPETTCLGAATEITFHLTGTAPFEISFSDGIENFTLNNIIENNYSITYNAESTATYTLLGVSDYYCISESFTPSSVTVLLMPTIPAIDAGMDAFVCGLNHTINGSEPTDASFNAFWTDLSGNYLNTGTSINTSALYPGVYAYIYFIENLGCGTEASDTIWVTYDLPEISNAGPNQQTCSESTQLSAIDLEMGQGYWLIPAALTISNPFDNNSFIYGMEAGNTYELLWVAESQFGVCNADTSSVLISVGNSSIAGNLVTESPIVCYGSSVQINAENHFGDIIGWIVSSGSASETINSSSYYFESNALTSTTTFQVIVQAGNCTPDTSGFLTIAVDPLTQPGNLIGSAIFCSTINEGEVIMTDYFGSILWWEISENNFETFNQINSSQAQYSFENLMVTTQFRTLIQSGSCPPIYSNTAVVEIGVPQNIDFEIATAFCSSDETIILNSLLTQGQSGNWTVNGINTDVFIPSNYAGLDIQIIVNSGSGDCFTEASQTVHVFDAPVANAGSDFEACGIDATLTAIPSAGNGFWSAGDDVLFNGNNNSTSVDILSMVYGIQTITWTETNGHCTSTDQVQVTFWQEPSTADAGDDQTLSYTRSTTLNAQQPVVGSGFWSAQNSTIQFDNLNDPKTVVRNLQIGENKLYWNVTNGNCAPKQNEIIVFVNPLIIPNGFTPNGDNVNDLYVIEGIETVSPVHISIVNRWGERVYENTDYNNEWDGRHKNGNDLPEDTYYYSLSTFGLSKKMTGFIVLKR
jgi:large repetitive protein